MNLTNYFDHPGDNRYTIYGFVVDEHADHFEGLLLQHAVDFERYEEMEERGKVILFGVSKRFQKESLNLNFLTHAKFRKPMIGNRALQWTLLLFTAVFITLAIIGYFKSR